MSKFSVYSTKSPLLHLIDNYTFTFHHLLLRPSTSLSHRLSLPLDVFALILHGATKAHSAVLAGLLFSLLLLLLFSASPPPLLGSQQVPLLG